jgi:hypothetical protein
LESAPACGADHNVSQQIAGALGLAVPSTIAPHAADDAASVNFDIEREAA